MRLACVCLIILLTTATPLSAAEVRVLAGDGSFATSDCIATTEEHSPFTNPIDDIQCFIDTEMACLFLQAHDLSPNWKGRPDIRRFCGDNSPGARYVQGQLMALTLMDFYYTHEIWTLSNADFPQEPYPLPELSKARAGDSVVDLWLLRCAPQTDCLSQFPKDTPASTLRAACPRTDCDDWSPDEADYAVPQLAYVLRWDGNAWRVTAIYTDLGVARGSEHWRPDHWKRK